MFYLHILQGYHQARAERRLAERLADGRSTGWLLLAVVSNGRTVPVHRAATHMVVTGDEYEVLVNGRQYETGSSRPVSDGEVRHIDVQPTSGKRAGQSLAQISRIDGDVLVACAAGPDAPRPTEFASPPGSGHTLSVWLRVR